MIPKQFSLFGETYKVKYLVKIDKEDSWGENCPIKNVIKIKKGLNQEQQEATYLHELVHCVLTNLGYAKLNDDEVFVDTFAKALHQILKTSK